MFYIIVRIKTKGLGCFKLDTCMHLIYLLTRGRYRNEQLANTYTYPRYGSHVEPHHSPEPASFTRAFRRVNRIRTRLTILHARRDVRNLKNINFKNIIFLFYFKMVRSKVSDGIHSDQIVSEVEKRPCLYDTNHKNYGDRTEKTISWEEVYEKVVPGWCMLGPAEKFAAGEFITLPFWGDVDSGERVRRSLALQPVSLQLSRTTCVLFVRSDAFEMYPVRSNVCANMYHVPI